MIAIIDRNSAFPHSRAEVKYECQLPPEYGDDQYGGDHPAISPTLASREEFLVGFRSTGELESDMTDLLIGTGQQEVLVFSRQHGLSLRELAESIRHSHQDELANLKQGGEPLWTEKNQPWSSDQTSFYIHLLELECKALDSILNRDSGSSRRSAA